MKYFKTGIPILLVLTGTMIVLSGCDGASGHQGVMETIKAANAPVEMIKATHEIPPEPLVRVSEEYQGGIFYTQARKDKMERFECSSCHTDDGATINDTREAVHGNIKLNHGAVTNPDACDTCHNMSDRNYLATEAVAKIDFDHSYQLCGTCHFRQKKDWVGGAHGKRIQNWAGKRAVLNCASCHSPHSPRFAKRWPATFSPPDDVLADKVEE